MLKFLSNLFKKKEIVSCVVCNLDTPSRGRYPPLCKICKDDLYSWAEWKNVQEYLKVGIDLDPMEVSPTPSKIIVEYKKDPEKFPNPEKEKVAKEKAEERKLEANLYVKEDTDIINEIKNQLDLSLKPEKYEETFYFTASEWSNLKDYIERHKEDYPFCKDEKKERDSLYHNT